MACLENKIRTKTNDELLSETISSLRFPLTVGVVFIHFNLAQKVFSIHGVKYGLNNPDWYYSIINFFSDVLPCIGVPLFFFISGFLFFYKKEFNGTVYRQIMHRRATTLMLPYFLWNFIAIMIKASHKLSFLSSIFLNAYKTVIVISPKRLINTFIDNYENEGVFSINNVSFVDYMRKIKYIPLLYLLWAVIDTFTKETLTIIYLSTNWVSFLVSYLP